MCISHNMSGYNMHIFNDEYTRRKSNYIEDPKIAKENRPWGSIKQMKQAIKRSKEPLDKMKYQMKDRYYDKIEKVVI